MINTFMFLLGMFTNYIEVQNKLFIVAVIIVRALSLNNDDKFMSLYGVTQYLIRLVKKLPQLNSRAKSQTVQ